MKTYSVCDEAFRPYGRVVEGLDSSDLLKAMEAIPMPETGTAYEPVIESLEKCRAFEDYQTSLFGGMPMELGMCWGRNTVLNALEYHRDSEFNLAAEDMILLLAKLEEAEDYMLDTARVKAFLVPAGTLVEIYATTLHYAPCHVREERGFRSLVALPRGTNTDLGERTRRCREDDYLIARNKWLLAHPESPEVTRDGRAVGLRGENIDIAAGL